MDSSHDHSQTRDDGAESLTNGTSPAKGEPLNVTAPFDHDAAQEDATKEERDVAFAMVALQAGRMTERQLTRAVANWTIHGSRSLAEHLESHGLVSVDESEKYKQLVESRGPALGRAKSSPAWERACQVLGFGHTASATAPSEPRSTHAQYTLLRRFGRGGMGNVWLARDESLNRLVAIKEVSQQAAGTPAIEARFRREAEVTGQLEHPNIVPVYQFGRDVDRNLPFYAMRFVGKKTLSDAISEYHARCDEGLADAVELHRLLNSFLSVCQAIAFAHSRNILHRDLKPENIALGNFGEVIVVDWGLAKRIDEGESSDGVSIGEGLGGSSVDNRTTAGQVLGTPLYMSPEQASGRIDSMDVRTDVYGLGATLFAILTGYAPHETTQKGLSQNSRTPELYSAIVDNPTPRVGNANQKVPVELDAICAKAMARTPAARYQTASDLAEDIQCWMAGESVSAYKEKWRTSFSRWMKRRTLTQWCLALFVVVAVVAGSIDFSARQSQLNADRATMNALQLDGKGLSVNLVTAIEEATENVRFMSKIPPIQGIIDARRAQLSVPSPDNTPEPEDDEETWRARLETIFTGLVMANSEYVSVSYLALQDNAEQHAAENIVRVERNRSDRAFVRSVPPSQLAAHGNNHTALAVSGLRAGDVHVADVVAPDDNKDAETPPKSHLDPLTADLSVPIFDESTGELFGAVVLTIDIEYLLTQRLNESVAGQVLLTNHQGDALASFRPRTGIQSHSIALESSLALPGSFLNSSATDHVHYPDEDHPNGLFAVKVQLDRTHPERTVILLFEGAGTALH